jgi:hypothetical protein
LENQINKNQVTERGDFNQSSNMQWFGRFGWTSENTLTPTLPQIGGALQTNSKQYMISNAWVLSPTKVNEFRFGYTTLYNAVEQILSGKTNVVANLGLPFPTEAPQSWGVPSVALALNGLSTFGDNTNGPFVINDSIRQFVDNFSWNHGKHSIRFGGEYRYDIYNQFGNQYTRSQLQYNGQYTANPANLVGGNAAADMDLGDLYRVDLALQVASSNDTANSMAFYIDDTYKMTSKLTITMGLRWEYEQPWLDTQQNMTNFYLPNGAVLYQQANVNPSLYPTMVRAGTNNNFYQGLNYIYENLTGIGQPVGTPVQVARDGRLGARMVNSDWKDYAPRFGIAYSPSPKWSIRTGFGVFYSQESQNNRFDTNRATAGRLTDLPAPNAPPTLTYGNSLGPAPYALNPGLTWAVQSNIGTPTSYMYLFNVQRQFGQASTLEVGYQGILDKHLENQLNLDAGIPNGTAAAASHVPYPMYSSGIEYTDGNGIGNYNALSAKLSQRYKSGVTTLVAFTYSKALDNGSAVRGSTGDQYPENPYCIITCEYGPSGFNTPFRLVTSIVYPLPFGKGQRFANNSGLANAVIGGWQVNTILTAQSGRALDSIAWDAGGQVVQPNANRLDSTGINPTAANADQHQWFNLASMSNPVAGTCVGFITPGCYNNTFGNMARNELLGPSTWTDDMALFKNIAIKERATFQIRFEVFNVFNHPALGSPNTTWGTTTQTPAATFGTVNNSGTTIGTAYAMREIQFGAKFIF